MDISLLLAINLLKPDVEVTETSAGEMSNNNLYAVFSVESMKVMANQVGVDDVQEPALLMLSADVTYRLRQIIRSASLNAFHMARKKVLVADIEAALEQVEVDVGVQTTDNKFVHIPDADVYTIDDEEIDLNTEFEELIRRKMEKNVSVNQTKLDMKWLTGDPRVPRSGQQDVQQSRMDVQQPRIDSQQEDGQDDDDQDKEQTEDVDDDLD